jgi:hypothetical protein
MVPVKTMTLSALEIMQCIAEMNQHEHVMSVTKSVATKFNVRLYYLPQDQWTSAGSLAQRCAESPSHPIDLFVEVHRQLMLSCHLRHMHSLFRYTHELKHWPQTPSHNSTASSPTSPPIMHPMRLPFPATGNSAPETRARLTGACIAGAPCNLQRAS